MSDEAFVNASPLILLARIGQLELLRLSGSCVWAPPEVLNEVNAKGSIGGLQAIDGSCELD